MKLTIFGAGYVGLVTAACFAKMGNYVTCIDIDTVKIGNLEKGILPIYEEGLCDLINENVEQGRLLFTTNSKVSVEEADIIFIAVGTPPTDSGEADLSFVLQVASTIAMYINEYKVIVTKSTVPVGTTDLVEEKIAEILQKNKNCIEFDVVSNPEFLKEGEAVQDCMKPDRIIVGAVSNKAIACMKELYAPFNRNHNKLILMDVRSAELTKYSANAMLATKISFINEISQIAERTGANIESVRMGIGADRRIGYDFIYPGCGYGGSCFPKDVSALVHTGLKHGYEPQLLKAVNYVNGIQKELLYKKIDFHYKGSLNGKIFAIWGIAFKPNTDDIREAPSRILIEQLWLQGAYVNVYDPLALTNFQECYDNKKDYKIFTTPEEALVNADALVILTEWTCFRSPDFDQIRSKLKAAVIFDGRNLFEPQYLKQKGFTYYSIGRKNDE